jgi:uncharacterized membrane protein YeaQ/YmgE (transglycosylase-associated protein family)
MHKANLLRFVMGWMWNMLCGVIGSLAQGFKLDEL